MPHSDTPDAPDAAAAPFLHLSKRVERRLLLSRWLEHLRTSALPAFGLLTAALGAAWVAGIHELPVVGRAVLPVAGVLVALWIVGCGVAAWTRRPGALRALAVFDQHRADEETFLSACSLARAPQRGPGADLHIRRAHAALAAAVGDLREAVPVRVAATTICMPLVFLAVAAFGLPDAARAPRPEDATVEAARMSTSLDEEARAIEQMEEGLSAEEQKRLATLKEDLEDSARKMADLQKEKSPRDVLEELEKRAKEAEALAEMLGAEGEVIGSAMLAELERHADTAELAGALRGQKLETAAKEANQMARRLRNPDLSLEARRRLERAFDKGLEAATPADLQTLLGRHLGEARSKLADEQPAQAAEAFEALARRYQQMRQRMGAMEALERLAENLRTSGQRALGRNQAGMKKIERVASAGVSKIGEQPVHLAMGPPPGARTSQATPEPGSPATGMPPGSAQPTPTARTTAPTPVPGTGTRPSAQPAGATPRRGAQPGGAQPGGAPPVPGTQPGPSDAPVPGTATQPGGT